MSKRGVRRWCFTVNNPERVLDDMWVLLMPYLWPSCTYCVYQLEQGEQATPHFQGYAEFDNAKTLSAVKKLEGLERAHFEVAKASAEENLAYCTKPEDRIDGPWVFGAPKAGQGKRTDLEMVKADIDAGAPEEDLWSDHFAPMTRYYKAFREYKRVIAPKRRLQATHITILGGSGQGKTAWVYETFPFEDIWKHPGVDDWHDGYSGQKVVLYDELDGSRFKLRYLLMLLDAYPMDVPVKGGFVPFCPEVIVITTNYEPETWYRSTTPWRDSPLRRRLELIERSVMYRVGWGPMTADCQSLGIKTVYRFPPAGGAPLALQPDPPQFQLGGVVYPNHWVGPNDPRPRVPGDPGF